MKLEDGGIDIYYVDESMDRNTFAMSAIPIPFLRQVGGTWMLTWEANFQAVRSWRHRAKTAHGLPVRSELKGSKLSAGRGRYKHGEHQFPRPEAARVMRALLADLGFLQPAGILTLHTASRPCQLRGVLESKA